MISTVDNVHGEWLPILSSQELLYETFNLT